MIAAGQMLRGLVVRLILFGLITVALGGQEEPLRKARELVRAGRAAEAIPIYQSLVSASPKDLDLRMKLAIAHFTARQYEWAIGQCETVLAERPASTAAWLFLGASHFQLGRPAEALPALVKVVAAKPEERNARLMLAESLLSLERGGEAISHFELLASSLADNPRVWYGLERAYTGLAESAAERLVVDAEDSAFVHALGGERLLEQGFYGQALFHFREALARLPELPGLYGSMREIYLETGHEDWAAAMEDEISTNECGEGSPRCAFLAGRYKDVLEDTAAGASPESFYWRTRAARELASQAMERLGDLPASAQLYEIQARKLQERGSYARAVESWRGALQLAPGNLVLERGLATSLHGNRDYEGALPLLEKLRAAEPDSVDLHFLEGSALLGMGRAEEAIPPLSKAVELQSDFLKAHGELGRAYMQLGKAEEAIPHLKIALPEDDDGSRRFQLVQAYRTLGRAEEAKAALEKYLTFRKQSEARSRELQAQFEIRVP